MSNNEPLSFGQSVESLSTKVVNNAHVGVKHKHMSSESCTNELQIYPESCIASVVHCQTQSRFFDVTNYH